MSLELSILRFAALLVPASERAEWCREWRSEFWYVQKCGWRRVMFCLGAFKDALWMRRNSPRERRILLQSPLHCVLLLVFLAALSMFFAFYLPGPRDMLRSSQFLFLVFIPWPGIAFLILPTVTSLSLGEYPHPPNWAMRSRRWIFLGIKIALVLLIVSFGTLDCSQMLSVTVLQPQATLLGYVLAFRWVLIDQRRRCPVCLRLLTNPTRIGQRSQSLLDWSGTELMCERGHGLLYVPEVQNSYSTQRWLYLDPSWQSLFS